MHLIFQGHRIIGRGIQHALRPPHTHTFNLFSILYPISFLYFHLLRVSFIALAHHLNSFHLEGLYPEHDRCSLLLLSFPCATSCTRLQIAVQTSPPSALTPTCLGVHSFQWTDGQTLDRPGRCHCGCKWKTDGLDKRTSVRSVEPRYRVSHNLSAVLTTHTPTSCSSV
jgi:hypothetical protein